jgi:hypothetical protein
MKLIVRQLVLYPQKDEDGAADAYRKANKIGDRKTFIAEDVAPGDFQIVSEHTVGK